MNENVVENAQDKTEIERLHNALRQILGLRAAWDNVFARKAKAICEAALSAPSAETKET